MFKDLEHILRDAHEDGNDLGFGTPEDRGDFVEQIERDTNEAGEDTDNELANDDTDESNVGESITDSDSGDDSERTEDVASEDEDTAVEGSVETEERQQTRKSGWVPKHRFDLKNTKLREAEARIAELEGKLAGSESNSDAPKVPTVAEIGEQISALDAEIAGAVKDADGDKVAQLLAKQRELQNQVITQTASQQATAAIRAEQAYNQTVDALEQADERLDPNSTAYDEAFTRKVGSVASAFEATGKSPAEALLQAAEVLGIGAEEVTEQPATEPAKTAEPRKTDVKKNVETAKRQPPDISKAGGNSTDHGQSKEIDVDKISDADFDALPENTLKRLRGDLF